MRWLLALLLLTGPVLAQPETPDPGQVQAVVQALGGGPKSGLGLTLAQVVQAVRSQFPAAQVTAGFYDWRTTSVYRRQAGLHLGYDIAAPAGTLVVAPWGGTVVDIVPWTADELGVTVECGSLRTTFGHLRDATVRTGQKVEPGAALGHIARNHTDVKMRDARGAYVDFGGSSQLAPARTRQDYILDVLVARARVDQTELDLERARQNQTLSGRAGDLEQRWEASQRLAQEGAARAQESEQARQLHDQALKDQELGTRARSQLQSAQHSLTRLRQEQALASGRALQAGISSAQVDGFVRTYVQGHPQLLAQIARRRAGDTPDAGPSQLDRLLQEGVITRQQHDHGL